MNRANLLERANHYRVLATYVTDEQARRGLLDLAEKYETLAAGDEGLSDPQTTPPERRSSPLPRLVVGSNLLVAFSNL